MARTKQVSVDWALTHWHVAERRRRERAKRFAFWLKFLRWPFGKLS